MFRGHAWLRSHWPGRGSANNIYYPVAFAGPADLSVGRIAKAQKLRRKAPGPLLSGGARRVVEILDSLHGLILHLLERRFEAPCWTAGAIGCSSAACRWTLSGHPGCAVISVARMMSSASWRFVGNQDRLGCREQKYSSATATTMYDG